MTGQRAPRVRVIGVGNPFAGDDGAGIEVVRRLRAEGLDPEVEAVEAGDATVVIDALQGVKKAVVVDAAVRQGPAGAVGDRRYEAGQVIRLTPEQLSRTGLTPLSTHGVGVADAIRLAQISSPRTVAGCIVVIAIVVERVRPFSRGLSPPVSAALDRAVRVVREELRRRDA
ncbi:MAG: hydrogenase maturation protease [Bacillota bacterium]